METRVPVPGTGDPDGNGRGYSVGHWISDKWDDRRFYYLTGGDPGVSFLSGFCPDDGRCFTILSNTEDGIGLVVKDVLALLRSI